MRHYWFVEALAEYASALYMEIVEGEGYQKPEKGRKAYMKQGYFHLKLLCMVALLVCDVMLSRKLFRMEGDGPNPEAWFFKVMHGVAGLALLAALAAVFIVRG